MDNRRVFSVEVYHVTALDLPPPLGSSARARPPEPEVRTLEELLAALQDRLRLWLTPFLVVSFRRTPDYDYAIFKDRGLRFRAWVQRKRLDDIFDHIMTKYRRHLKVKRLRKGLGRTKHIVMTITLDPKKYSLSEAYRYIPKRLRQIREYVRRRYGLLAYVAVLEVHESGYPHLHALFIVKKPLKVFKYKRVWRFVHKRVWEKDLNATEGDFIDCFALHSYGVKDYFRKYVEKFLDPNVLSSNELNIKSLALPIARLFRIRTIYTNVRLPKPKPLAAASLDDVVAIGRLIEEYSKARDLLLKAKLYREIRDRIVSMLVKRGLLGNDLISYISRIGSGMAEPVEDPRLAEVLERRLEEKIKQYWRFCYSYYLFSYKSTLVLGYRYSLEVSAVG